MPDYDFRSLSSYDFEILCRDLLQEELHIRLESFTRGTDGGIDFRCQNENGALVVQCKHYESYDELYRVLSKKELPKVHKLKPSRYLIAVSTALTPHRKDSIVSLFSPYCKTSDDVFGRDDLNNLLRLHPEIERANFKLWLTSETVLTRILQAGVWGDTELTLDRIRRRTDRYVPNPSYDRAKKILEEHHFCLIAGIPGIGKTTLAEILLIDYVDRHGFHAIRIANDLSEIKAVKNPRERQIFYFDDFLGTKALDTLQKNEDRRLFEFLDEVKLNEKWRFVLTTREYILNAAKSRYESFASPAVPLSLCTVELSDYTRRIRAKILYNHIYFSNLERSYKRALLEGRKYERILSHSNYNPRIIEHMTQAQNAEQVFPEHYFDDFLQNLSNPVRVWDHAFRHQLGEAAQHLLVVMSTLPDEVLVEDLRTAFNAYYQYRRQKFGFATGSRDFENTLRELDGNFVKTWRIGDAHVVSFHNPSVGDFLDSYLSSADEDVGDLVNCIVFFDQFEQLWQGNHGEVFHGITTRPGIFIRKLSEQFSSRICRIIRVGDGNNRIIGVHRVERSFESRLEFALRVANGLNSPEAQEFVRNLFETLEQRLTGNCGDKDDLLQLIRVTSGTKMVETVAEMWEKITQFMTHRLNDLEDFVVFGKFVSFFRNLIPPDSLDDARSAFSSFVENYDEYSAENPDDLRFVADEIEAAGRRLDVQVGEVVSAMRDRAFEMEDDQGSAEADDDDDWHDRWQERSPSVEDVDAMFNSLLGEINERDS